VDIEDYVIPWAMFILVVLPWFAPLVAMWISAISFAIAGGISGANFAIISKEDWTPALRVTITSLITGLLYPGAVAVLVLQIIYLVRFGPRF
jgi:protein gp37